MNHRSLSGNNLAEILIMLSTMLEEVIQQFNKGFGSIIVVYTENNSSVALETFSEN